MRNIHGKTAVYCQCKCGKSKWVTASALNLGYSKSCGCFRFEAPTKHGESRTRLYRLWYSMIARCEDPRATGYKNYGGRGIKVCEKWKNDCLAFKSDMPTRPSIKHSLDRFPNKDGNYEPGNVRWATRTQQGRNRRTNRCVTALGKTLCLAEWVEKTGITRGVLKYRLSKGIVGKALFK